MESLAPNKKLEPGVYQGAPESTDTNKVSSLRVIRTMKSDASEAIRDNEETTVSIAVAEEKKRAKQQAEALAEKRASAGSAPAAPKPIGRFVVVLIVLFIAALLGLAYVFVLPKLGGIKLPSISLPSFPSFGTPSGTNTATSTAPSIVPPSNSMISSQTEKHFSITKQTLAQVRTDISAEIKNGVTPGSIENIFFTEESGATSTVVSTNRLIAFTNIPIPDILARSLENRFMIGIIGESSSASTPFIVLKVSEGDTAVAGMLEWEASLQRSFNVLFGTTVEGAATSAKFSDIVITGKDARLITDAFGNTIAYAFANPATIVIAGSRTALETLLPLAAKN